MPIDYDNASRTYDQTRDFDRAVVDALAKRAALSERSRVLDFGCGTGNYLVELHCRFSCRCFGVDPSSGMRRAATDKCPELTVREGDHRSVPFEDGSFDLIYLTDVLHHVPDLPQLFAELRDLGSTVTRHPSIPHRHVSVRSTTGKRYRVVCGRRDRQIRSPAPLLICRRTLH